MIGSLWSGISGLRAHQTQLDVIGNDVANVNTVGYKQSNVTFQDAFYQSLTSAGDATAGKQVGLGVNVGKITKDFNDGLLQETGIKSHMAIAGDGFFVLNDEASGGSIETATYTRAGDFELSYDSANGGTLRFLGPSGKYLHGTAGGVGGSASTLITLPADVQDVMISSEGIISYIAGPNDPTGAANSELVSNAFTVDIATFGGADALSHIGGNQYQRTPASGNPSFSSTDNLVVQGHLENSNVDLAKEFTEMIVAERGFQANSRTITTSDSMLQELLNIKR